MLHYSRIVFVALFIQLFFYSYGQNDPSGASRITSMVDSSSHNELVLIQKLKVRASLDAVWHAYTTKEGWENWAVPLAEVDLKVGGTIKTNYNEEGVMETVRLLLPISLIMYHVRF